MIQLRAGSATDVGLVRTNNQDRLLMADPLFAVADGMGGAAAGEVASATAVEGLQDAFGQAGEATPEALMEAARTANRAVWNQAEANPEMRGMGTTLVALALVDGGRLAAVNIGDSRLYLLRGDEFRQVTSDHNLVAELVAEGRISKEEAEFHPRRNIMTRALGVDPDVEVDLFVEEPRPGDRYLLCSDGLPRELRDDHMVSILRRFADPEEAAKELVDEAKRRGGNDNITAVVVDVVDTESSAAPAPEQEKDPTVVVPTPAPEPSPAAEPRDAEAERGKPTAKVITLRVVAFFGVLILVLALAAVAIGWYARGSYFVGLRGDRVTIYQGRPGGVLWFDPTVAQRTNVTTGEVLPHQIPRLRAGQEESSLADARAFVRSLVAEANAARSAQSPTTTAPSSSVPTPSATSPPPTT
ncbi:MAG TPA: Stp1/IreP family PP2C-type Ser/Thr phosphatase [Acidimicrobiales bacterium]